MLQWLCIKIGSESDPDFCLAHDKHWVILKQYYPVINRRFVALCLGQALGDLKTVLHPVTCTNTLFHCDWVELQNSVLDSFSVQKTIKKHFLKF